MKHRLGAAALILSFLPLFSVSPVTAQTTTPTPPTIAEIVAARVARLTKLLTLTTAEAATATSLFTIEETALETLETSEATAVTALDTAIEANTGVAAAVAALGLIRTQEIQAKATADAAFYLILTTTQQAIEKELLAAGLDSTGHCKGPGGH